MIREIALFNKLDLWQAGAFDVLFNYRYNICYGSCLKQLQRRPGIKAAKRPRVMTSVHCKTTHRGDGSEPDGQKCL